jgi:hypothetical protein
MNNKVYLNDIPLDLFFEYFTSEDLQDNFLEPALINDLRTFFKYSVVISSTTYTHYSVFNSVVSPTELEEEIRSSFADIINNADTVEITSITLIDTNDTLETLQSYISNSSINLLINNYYFQRITGERIYSLLFGNALTLTPENEIEITLKDYRLPDLNPNHLIGENLDGYLVNGNYELYSGVNLIGYLIPNTLKTIQEIDNNGNPYFLNEAGEKVIEFLKRSNFLAHNNALRKSVFLLEKPEDIIAVGSDKFTEGKVGMFKLGEENRKLLFYQNFEKTTTYTKITDFTSPFDWSIERIAPNLKVSIDEGLYIVEENIPIIKDIQNILDLRRIKATEDVSTYKSIYESFIQNENIIVDVVRKTVNFEGVNYTVSSSDTITVPKNTNTHSLSIVLFNNIHYLRLPINLNDEIELGSNPLSNIKKQANNTYLYKKSSYTKQEGVGYTYGFISIPIVINTSSVEKSYIAKSNSSGNTTTLSKFLPVAEKIPFDYNNFPNSELYTYDTISETYKRTSYIKDEIDPTYAISIVEEITPPTNDPDLSVITNFSGATLLETFYNAFVVANMIKTDNYYAARGKLIPDDQLYNIKKELILNMTIDYLSKSSEFFITTGIIYDKDNFWKMRIISESFQKIIGYNKLERYIKSQNRLSFNNICDSIFLSKEDPKLTNVNVKDYSDVNFSLQKLQAFSEINSLNPFQKILEYKKFPYNQKRQESLYEEKKRRIIFSEFDNSKLALEQEIIANIKPKDQILSKIDFKDNILSLVSSFFFGSNTYSNEETSYITFYYKYINDKIKNVKENFLIANATGISYKATILKDDIRVDNTIILEKIFSKDDDWRVI